MEDPQKAYDASTRRGSSVWPHDIIELATLFRDAYPHWQHGNPGYRQEEVDALALGYPCHLDDFQIFDLFHSRGVNIAIVPREVIEPYEDQMRRAFG